MPLLDHFHPPLSQQRHWDSAYGAWAEAIAKHLNEGLLPERYFAEARVKISTRVEIDVSTFTGNGESDAGGVGVALWAPPRPAAVVPLEFTDPGIFEVQVFNDEGGPRVVAAIELASPANKDRPSNRRAFAVKCASYLHEGVGVIVVDVVTERKANLHAELLDMLKAPVPPTVSALGDLYAVAYRTTIADEGSRLELWPHGLTLGGTLPTLPLWIHPEQSVPVELERTYQAARAARRIP